MYCIIKCIVQGKQARVKNANLRHPSSMCYKEVQPVRGPGSSVRTATGYGLDIPGIKSQWGRYFPPVQTGSEVHPASCTMGTGCFPG